MLQVLFEDLKYKNYPFEWVYEGVAPALLTEVVKRQKGMPITLACLYWLVVSKTCGLQLDMVHKLPPSAAVPKGAWRPVISP